VIIKPAGPTVSVLKKPHKALYNLALAKYQIILHVHRAMNNLITKTPYKVL